MASSSAPLPSPASKSKRFLINVLWMWTGVATNLVVAFLLNPYMIRKLGPERYGIWALIFTIIDYFWFFDIGLNTAVATFCARYLAENETEKINEVINTSLFYFSIISLLAMGTTMALSHNVRGFFRISPEYQPEFSTLIQLAGMSWAICILMNMFVSALAGFQRFDLESRVIVWTIALRSLGYFVLLKLGYGLVPMAAVFVFFQVLGNVVNLRNFEGIFPALRFSRKLVKLSVFREIAAYGLKSFFANAATLVLNQSGPVMIGHFQTSEFVGFYTLPSRILQYAADAVSRVGMVTRSSAAELSAIGENESVVKLGVYSNRYSLTLFMPVVVLLAAYGRDLILRWVGPEYATNSAPLLPIFLVSTALVMAGQFNSSSLLYGLGAHGGYARGVIVEAILNVCGMIYAIPRYGIIGAAVVSSGLALVFRGIYTPWLVCRSLNYGFFDYLRRIYVRPLLTGIPVMFLALALKARWMPGKSWFDLLGATCVIGVVYAALAFFTCIEREHRAMFLSRIPFVGERLAAAAA